MDSSLNSSGGCAGTSSSSDKKKKEKTNKRRTSSDSSGRKSNIKKNRIKEAKDDDILSQSPLTVEVKEEDKEETTISATNTSKTITPSNSIIPQQPPSNLKQTISQFSSWSQAFQAAASIKPHDLGNDYIDPLLQEVDEDGDKKKVPYGSGDVFGVSQIVVECIQKKEKKKKKELEEFQEEESKKQTLENLMMEETNEKMDIGKGSSSGSGKETKPPKKKKTKKKDKKDKRKKRDAEKKIQEEEKEEGMDTHYGSDDVQDDGQQLEGKMITHQNKSLMVLIDKGKRVVYSGVRRSLSGGLIQIGLINDDEVVITQDISITLSRTEEVTIKNQGFPFHVDPDDHCESPLTAYQDIQPILDKLVELLGKKSKEKLKLYDPYYCNGSVIQHLNSLGYTKVHNKKEDCYKVWSNDKSGTNDDNSNTTKSKTKSRKYPKYDVFVTNPPYSSDHIEKLMLHLTTDDRTKGKPWCLLMPTFVHKKEYYKDKIASKKNHHNLKSCDLIQPFYLIPKKRYVYLPPKDFREKKVSDVHKKSSPFVSMWYVWGGTKENTDLLVQAYQNWEKKNHNCRRCDLARGKSALRDLRRRKK